MNTFDRRALMKYGLATVAGLFFSVTPKVWARTYMTADQAKEVMFGNASMTHTPIELTKDQMKAIRSNSKVRVRSSKVNGWKVDNGGWFILDQVIGKHENIDIAVGLDANGKVVDIEILEYRETYGYQVANPKWLAQFTGKDSSEHLDLDEQIQNISGATLSCAHITDGINRLTNTWNQVLRHK